MADENEIVLRNLGGKQAVKVISNDQGQVVLATEENVPLQPTNPAGKLDEYAIHDNEANEISALTEKGAPADADLIIIEDSEAGFAKKKTEIGNLGGGGASSFLGLSDTPNAYTAARAFLCSVEDIADPTKIEFIDPATLPVGAHNHDGVYSPVAHDHAGVYSPVAHDHSGVYSPVAHTHTDFLAKVGGIMSGNIDFSDVQEGIRFWDLDAAYFKAFYFDDAFGHIVIGDNATGLGGPPPVRVKSPLFLIGYDGIGQSDLWMWEDTASDFLPVITLVDGGNCDIGPGDRQINLKGSTTRPNYNDAELALKSDVPTSGTYDVDEIPHRSKGTGQFIPIVLNGISVYAGLGSSETVRVSVRDLVYLLKGGVASPSYSFNMNVNSAGWIGANADPNAVYYDFDFDVDNQTNIVAVRCSDGTTSVDVETYVIIQGTAGGGGP